eukprot:Nk52_evm8s368 gene=Nk52_evmTU8s368
MMAVPLEAEVTEPTDFKDARFQEIDRELRCGICFEFCKTAMMLTSCSHNFCSLCIRNYLAENKKCPSCFTPATKMELKNNRAIERLICTYSILRPQLLLFANEGKVVGNDNVAPKSKRSSSSFSNKDNESKNRRSVADKSSMIASETKSEVIELDDSDSCTSLPQEVSTAETSMLGSATKKRKMQPASTPLSGKGKEKASSVLETEYATKKQKTEGSESKAGILITCPICSHKVPEKLVNSHMDNYCLKGEKDPENYEVTVATRVPANSSKPVNNPRLPVRFYNSLRKESALKQVLVEDGLPTHGNRDEMINRHKEFVRRFNSEADKITPRPREEIIKEVMMHEETTKNYAKQAARNSNRLSTVIKNVNEEQVRKRMNEYINEHREEFNRLIEQARLSAKRGVK